MPRIDPADLESPGAQSVDLTDVHNAVLRQLRSEAGSGPEPDGE